MADYIDVMDPSRVIRPLQSNKNRTVQCKVFWRERVGDKEVRVYGGLTTIPEHLFLTGEEREDRDSRTRTGFIPETKAERLPAKGKSRKAKRRERSRNEDESYED